METQALWRVSRVIREFLESSSEQGSNSFSSIVEMLETIERLKAATNALEEARREAEADIQTALQKSIDTLESGNAIEVKAIEDKYLSSVRTINSVRDQKLRDEPRRVCRRPFSLREWTYDRQEAEISLLAGGA